MSKLSRMVLGAVGVTVVIPALAATPAVAATAAVTYPPAVVASAVVMSTPNVSRGWCRIFPKMCFGSASPVVGLDDY